MIEFIVRLTNRPGMLATLTEQLAMDGINIEAVAAFGHGEDGVARLIVDSPERARRVIESADLVYAEREVLVTTLPHEPGAMADMTRRLAESGANIDALYLLRSHAEGLDFAVALDQAPHDLPAIA